MTIDRNLLDRIRSRGEEVLTQLSAELMSSRGFAKAVEGALRGREKLEHAAATALKEINVPTRGELNRANSRIEALEREIAQIRSRARAAAGSAARRRAAEAPAGPKKKAAGRRTRPRAGTRRTE